MDDLFPTITAILFFITCVGALVSGVFWLGLLYKVLVFLKNRPTARAGIALCKNAMPTDRIVVVIPAHNESRVIEHLVKSLRDQTYPYACFLLVLDRCTDDTLEKARVAIGDDARFLIHEVTECPADWAGKVHAIHSAMGFLKSRGDLPDALLFADADTRFAPEVIAATLAILRDRKLELLSLLSTLSTDKWFEKVVQTAASMEIGRMFPLSHVNALENRRAFANGQFMLFDARAYESFGGHLAVKDAILEDLALARLMAQQRRPAQVLLADNLIRCHMYDTFGAFTTGWKRIYIECVNWKVSRLSRYGWSVILMGCILPVWSIGLLVVGTLVIGLGVERELAEILMTIGFHGRAATIAVSIGATAFVAYFGALGLIYRIAGAPLICVFVHPVGAMLVGGILLDAARDVRNRVPIRWGGREYTREPR